MNGNCRISVIVPTLAEAARAQAIKRAIESIRASSTEAIRIVVIVNGSRSDKCVCDWLRRQSDVLFDQIAEGSPPLAQRRGRQLIETEYFSFLDDDDEYLPGATDRKLERLSQSDRNDLVVCNGFRSSGGREQVYYAELGSAAADPLAALFRENWLASCNALFRSATIPCAFFDRPHPYAEWTWLAYRLMLAGKQVEILNEPGFRINDTPGSLSKSDAYRASYFSLYERMLLASPPPEIARTIRRRVGSAWHDRSVEALAARDWRRAFFAHLCSLWHPGGYRYFWYSRRLLPGWPES